MHQQELFRHSATRWDFLRHGRLNKDKGRCVGCGAFASCVHHRRYVPVLQWLASVCRACHARLHRRAVWSQLLGFGRLYELWVEYHPGGPVQMALAFR